MSTQNYYKMPVKIDFIQFAIKKSLVDLMKVYVSNM